MDGFTSPALLPKCYLHTLGSGWVQFVAPAVLWGHPTVLASPIGWCLHKARLHQCLPGLSSGTLTNHAKPNFWDSYPGVTTATETVPSPMASSGFSG